MRVGTRTRRRIKTIKTKRKIITDGMSAFLVLSTVSVVTVRTVSTLVDFISNTYVKSTTISSNINKDIDVSEIKDIKKAIKLAKEDINLKFYGSTFYKYNSDLLVLVNKNNKLDASYVPNNLVIPKIQFNGSVTNKYVIKEVAIALETMFNDAKKEGVILLGVSGYRTYEYQDNLYKNKVATQGKSYANKYVAVAGASEHQLGMAIDLVSSDYTKLNSGFANTDAFKWLENNMQNYGFILRYPKDKEGITGYAFEPWHLRYVGVDYAKEIKKRNLTLEEYLAI